MMKKIGTTIALVASATLVTMTNAQTIRIIGGDEATPGDWPSIVSLQINGNHICGGTLIAPNKVLTAAHCIDGRTAGEFEVLVGAHDLTAHPNAETFDLQSIVIHENFVYVDEGNDIAFLILDGDSNQPSANLITPEQMDALATGEILETAGWGVTAVGGQSVDILRDVEVPLVDQNVCRAAYPQLDATMVCAGLQQGGQDACQGDSGGPLVAKINGDDFQLGIVSWGRGCALPEAYGVYARVSAFEPWYPAPEKIVSSADFENDFGSWTQVGGSHNWLRSSSGTPSVSTGPLGAADGDFYSYIETSNGHANTAGNSAHLVSPAFDALDAAVAFDYHMVGDNIGSLHLDVFNGTNWIDSVWSQTGAQQSAQNDHWRKASVDLSAFSGVIQIRLRALAAGGWQGDIAIDNIAIMSEGSGQPQLKSITLLDNAVCSPLMLSGQRSDSFEQTLCRNDARQVSSFYATSSGRGDTQSFEIPVYSTEPAASAPRFASAHHDKYWGFSFSVGNASSPGASIELQYKIYTDCKIGNWEPAYTTIQNAQVFEVNTQQVFYNDSVPCLDDSLSTSNRLMYRFRISNGTSQSDWSYLNPILLRRD